MLVVAMMAKTKSATAKPGLGEDEFSLDGSLGFVVNRTAITLATALERVLAPHNVTPQQWALLNRLWEQDGMSQRELAERLFKDAPNTARILDRLERKGLVVRRPAPDDRRVTLIFLTAAGRGLKPHLIPLALRLLERACFGLDGEELASALRVLNRIHDNLD